LSRLLSRVISSAADPEPGARASPLGLAELDNLSATRVGHDAQAALGDEVARGACPLEPFSADDVSEAPRVMERYADLRIGLADASVVVLAHRHRTLDLLCTDERHFRALRGPGGRPFRLLPFDA
jgi:uncharacterized protein